MGTWTAPGTTVTFDDNDSDEEFEAKYHQMFVEEVANGRLAVLEEREDGTKVVGKPTIRTKIRRAFGRQRLLEWD